MVLGISPLHFAAMNGHLTTCEALLLAGISRDARTKVDRTPLHLAAQEGHADIVELLLRHGADLEARDMLRMSALHWAAERGHAPVVQVLIRLGADPHAQNKFEMTPVEIATSKGHTDAVYTMLNTQLDLVSASTSVGRMAAPLGCDLSDMGAVYILTDEETLVPAAPPADEVIVTATTVDDAIVTIVSNEGGEQGRAAAKNQMDEERKQLSEEVGEAAAVIMNTSGHSRTDDMVIGLEAELSTTSPNSIVTRHSRSRGIGKADRMIPLIGTGSGRQDIGACDPDCLTNGRTSNQDDAHLNQTICSEAQVETDHSNDSVSCENGEFNGL
ncbi:unnamed protein product [Protopolystoma xenopodis]|uniref:Uncharacterized protein n=1 Tax=Protopolystoma xenopodis TaxID=117903 RepID=A0A3S5AZX9_9PLAT|nr:unnamed protein product [Protopolystoma xenopodis]